MRINYLKYKNKRGFIYYNGHCNSNSLTNVEKSTRLKIAGNKMKHMLNVENADSF